MTAVLRRMDSHVLSYVIAETFVQRAASMYKSRKEKEARSLRGMEKP